MGALDTAREAQALAEGFRSRGAAGYVFMKDGDGEWSLVLLGKNGIKELGID